MTRLKLHYDGWLVLPPAFRRALGLATGDPLEAELVDGAIVLRPVAKAAPKARAAAAAEPEQAASGDRTGEPAPIPRRKPEGEDEPAPRVEEAVRSELRRTRPPPAPGPHQPRALARDPRPERRGPEGHGEREKQPFRQVEVRKLGPGRGHQGRPRASGVPVARK